MKQRQEVNVDAPGRWWENDELEKDEQRQQRIRMSKLQKHLEGNIAKPPNSSTDPEFRHLVADGICYRLYCVLPNGPGNVGITRRYEDDGYDLDEDVKCTRDPETGHYTLSLPNIGPQFFKFIVGGKGSVREGIEKDTGATIRVPKPLDTNGCIVIRGLSEGVCIAAKLRIDIIVAKSQTMLDYTHFISIPLVSAYDSVSNLLTLIDSKYSGKSRGVDSSIFQRPQELHLTMLMLRLYHPDEVARARHLLYKVQDFIDDVFNPRDRVWLKGLQYMNDDPSDVHVLYLQVAENETSAKILKLVDYISKLFINAGLATENEIQHNEKLHATIMNSKWRKTVAVVPEVPKEEFEETTHRREERIPFDIRDIMAEFEHEDLGKHPILTLELSRMGAKTLEGYWVSDQTIPFPNQDRN